MRKGILRTVAIASALTLMAFGNGASATQGRHCAYRLHPIGRSGDVIQTRLVKVGCFDTFDRALSAGSGGAIRTEFTVTPATLTDDLISQTTELTTSVLIGTEYTVLAYGGSSNSYFAPDTCMGNIYELDNVGISWNDDFESGKGFGGCDHNKKFSAANFGGDVLTCTPNCNDYGSLRNEVTSLRWKP